MSAPAATPWLVCFKPSPGARLRLYCFPFAGGGAAIFRPWALRLWPEIEVWAVRLPARETRLREAPLTRFADVVPILADTLGPRLAPGGMLFGHSLGGLLAFEVARRLAHQPAALRALIVAGARGPAVPRTEPDISQLDDARFVDELTTRYSGIPQAVRDDPQLLEFFLPVLRADIALFEDHRFQPGPPLPYPLHAFGGNTDPRVDRSHLEAWRDHTAADFSLHQFEGGHFFVQDSAETVLNEIARIGRSRSQGAFTTSRH